MEFYISLNQDEVRERVPYAIVAATIKSEQIIKKENNHENQNYHRHQKDY